MKPLLIVLLLCFPCLAFATSVLPKPLDELVRESDHVVVATIIAVEMVDGHGDSVTDRDARTGPGLDNEMRFFLQVKHVLFTRSDALPPVLMVPLWSMWHYELGDMQDQMTGSAGIFLLKGNYFQPTYPAGFQRSFDERPEIERLLASPAVAD